MLHFLYSKDKTTYLDERQRVQQGFLMIIHASSGLRPSSVTQSNKGPRKMEADKTAGVVEEVVKLRYRDVALLVGEDEQGRARFAVEALFTYFKGGNRRSQRFVEHCVRSRVALIFKQKDIHLDRSSGHPHMPGRPSSRPRTA